MHAARVSSPVSVVPAVDLYHTDMTIQTCSIGCHAGSRICDKVHQALAGALATI